MTFPEIKLVDAPSATANVLFDFNDITATPRREVHADDFTIGFPELVGDVDAIDPLYGSRTVSFTCAMTGTKPQVAAAQSALARRLLAPGQGWLWVRMTATSRLLFFRTYRAQPGDLSFELVQTTSATKAERWELQVDLPCEAFVSGERVTIPAMTLSSDPTAGTNPLRLVLPPITGDAPTPLDFIVQLSSVPNVRNAVTVMSHANTVARPTIQLPIGTGDGASLGPDTSAPASNAAFVGGSYREVSFATMPGLETRVVLPNATGMIVGRYRALLRVAATNGSSTFQAMLFGPSTHDTPTVTFSPSGTAPTWVDLGPVTVPRQPSFSPNGPAQDTSHSIGNVRVARTAGSGSLRMDHLMFVPESVAGTIEARQIRAATENAMTAGTLYLDGTYGEASSNANGWGNIEQVGTSPQAVPGATNTLSFILASTPFAADDITRTAQVTISYYPLFLYVGDS